MRHARRESSKEPDHFLDAGLGKDIVILDAVQQGPHAPERVRLLDHNSSK